MANEFNVPYYNETIKSIVIAFGSLFSDLKVIRNDNTDVTKQTVFVPIAYGPKEKHFVRVDQDPELEKHVQLTLPRMGFEITGYSYDSSRKVNRNSKIACKDANGNITYTYAPVPYNVDISLYVVTKGSEDGFAICEQILPMFSPEYNLSIKLMSKIPIIKDVPLVLNGVSIDDSYDGGFEQKRLVVHTFSFTAKADLFGAAHSGKIILNTDIDVDTKQLNAGQLKRVDIGNINTGTSTGSWIPE